MKASIHDSHINLEGFRYFTGSASGVLFGGYGRKRTPVGAPNYLDLWSTLPEEALAKVNVTVTRLDVTFAESKGIRLFAGIKVPGLAKGHVDLSLRDFSESRVRLVKVSPKGDEVLVRQINACPAVLDKLVEFDGGARVVESVLIAVEAETYSEFSAGLSSAGAVVVKGVLVKAERAAEWRTETKVGVGEGTCIGYSLAEPKWDAVLDRKKTRVLSLRPDQQGLI